MDDDERMKYKGVGHSGMDHSAPYPVSRMAPAIELVDLARQISEADRMVNTRVSAKLKVIADQIKSLQREARAVLEEARQDLELHNAQCSFKRIPGRIYHLYQRDDGTRYFSMLSPQDWNASPPHSFMGSYRLENDLSWTPEDSFDTPDDTRRLVAHLLGDVSVSIAENGAPAVTAGKGQAEILAFGHDVFKPLFMSLEVDMFDQAGPSIVFDQFPQGRFSVALHERVVFQGK